MLSFRSLSAAVALTVGTAIVLSSQPVRAGDITVDVDVYRPRPVYVAPRRAVYVGPRRVVYVAPAPVCRWRAVKVRVDDHVVVRRVRTCR